MTNSEIRDLQVQLGGLLLPARTPADVGQALQVATDELWNWDGFVFSVPRSGHAKMRSLQVVTTIDGAKMACPATDNINEEFIELCGSGNGGPALINRPPAKVTTEETHPGDNRTLHCASLIFAPVRFGGHVLAMCCVQSFSPNRFAETDRDALALLCDEAGPVLARCQAEEQAQVLASLSWKLNVADTQRDAAAIVGEAADCLLGWDSFHVTLLNEGGDTTSTIYAMDLIAGTRQPIEVQTPVKVSPLMRRIIAEGPQMILREGPMEQPVDTYPLGDETRPSASLLFVPIRGPSGTFGALSVQSYEYRAYREEDIPILQALADHCSGALERTRAQEALRAREERYRQIITKTGAVPYQLDYRSNKYVFMGEGILAMTGYSAEEFTWDLWDTWLSQEGVVAGPDDGLDFQDAAAQARAGDVKQWKADLRIRTRSGEIRWLEDTSVQLYSDGKATGSLGILHDITERKLAEEKLKCQVARLNALRSIDQAITGNFDLRMILDVVLDHVVKELGVDAASVLVLNAHTRMLEFAGGRGFRSAALKYTKLQLGQPYAGLTALSGKPLSIPDIDPAGSPFAKSPDFAQENFVSYHCMPLSVKGRILGVLEVFGRSRREADDDWLSFFAALADQTAIAVNTAAMFTEMERSNEELALAYDTTLEGWSKALDLRDKETEGHTRRVAEATVTLARAMAVGEKELMQIRCGALLHDIGKMGLPDSILLKQGPLTEAEWEIMKKHPVYAFELLSPINFLQPALDIPYCHHEKWDGTGYPRGLKEEQIPLAARIFAVIDVWDALTSDRPYRKAWEPEKVCGYIESLSGTHFDPKVVQQFLRVVSELG